MNRGVFLQQKLLNMSKWLQENGSPHTLELPTQIEVVAVACILKELYSETIDNRDFAQFHAEKENLPPQIHEAVEFVESRPELHDKFWRYLQLFSEVVVGSNE